MSKKLSQTPNRDCGPIAPAAKVLQRACACGSHTLAGAECKACAAGKTGSNSSSSEQTAAENTAAMQGVLESPGQPLDTQTRAFMEPRFGRDFSRVNVHTGTGAAESAEKINATAYTVGKDVVFGSGRYNPRTSEGRGLLAHELTHVAQQSSGEGGHGSTSDSSLEQEAHSPFLKNRVPGSSPSFSPAGVRLQPNKGGGPSPELEFGMMLSAAKGGMSSDDAGKTLEIYKKLSTSEREKVFNAFYPSGEITTLLFALKPADAAGPYVAEVAQLLRWVEEAETRKASGMTDDQMAEVQAKYKIAEAKKDAEAKIKASTPKGATPTKPTEKEIEDARKEKVQKTSVQPTTVTTWDKMSKTDKESWEKRGENVITKVVAYAAKKHPELKLTKDNFLADFEKVEKRGKFVLAHGGTGPKAHKLAVFGFRFVEAAEADEAYVMSVVVHEVFGHPEYGQYGTEYHFALYDKAQAKIPGYKKPAEGTQERLTEKDAYAYQETEIYSLLRSLPYHTPIAAKDQKKGLVSIDPASTVEARLHKMKQQWEPKLAVAIVHGLYQRLLQDPRITGTAINAFRDGVKAVFPAEAKEILK